LSFIEHIRRFDAGMLAIAVLGDRWRNVGLGRQAKKSNNFKIGFF